MYQRKDAFYARAKRVGYRSRAAFKLEEIAKGARLFHPGDRVVDLGAWPGGWLQVAAREVGPTGRVVGVDLQPIDPFPNAANVVVVTGDVTDEAIGARITAACEGKADVVLSDLAPKLSGVRARDEARARALGDRVVGIAEQVLKLGGSLVVKLFMSEDLPAYVARLRAMFHEARSTRLAATRKGSAETYVVARGFRGSPRRE